MEIKYAINISMSVLLVTYFYASFSISELYAAIRDPKFDTGDCETKNGKQTCCWVVPGTGVIKLRVTYCQTCTYYHDANGEAYEKCTDPKKQTIQAQPALPGSNLLQNGQNLPELKATGNNTSTSNDDTSLGSKLPQKGGDLQLERNDNTTLKDDQSK